MIVFPNIVNADINDDLRKKLSELYTCFGADIDGDVMHEWQIIDRIIVYARKGEKADD